MSISVCMTTYLQRTRQIIPLQTDWMAVHKHFNNNQQRSRCLSGDGLLLKPDTHAHCTRKVKLKVILHYTIFWSWLRRWSEWQWLSWTLHTPTSSENSSDNLYVVAWRGSLFCPEMAAQPLNNVIKLHKQAHKLAPTHTRTFAVEHLLDWPNIVFDLADWEVLHNSDSAEECNSCELNDFTFHWKSLPFWWRELILRHKSLNEPQNDSQVDFGRSARDKSNK